MLLFMVCFVTVFILDNVVCFCIYGSDILGTLRTMALEMSGGNATSRRYKGALIGSIIGSITGMIVVTMILDAIVRALL